MFYALQLEISAKDASIRNWMISIQTHTSCFLIAQFITPCLHHQCLWLFVFPNQNWDVGFGKTQDVMSQVLSLVLMGLSTFLSGNKSHRENKTKQNKKQWIKVGKSHWQWKNWHLVITHTDRCECTSCSVSKLLWSCLSHKFQDKKEKKNTKDTVNEVAVHLQ